MKQATCVEVEYGPGTVNVQGIPADEIPEYWQILVRIGHENCEYRDRILITNGGKEAAQSVAFYMQRSLVSMMRAGVLCVPDEIMKPNEPAGEPR